MGGGEEVQPDEAHAGEKRGIITILVVSYKEGTAKSESSGINVEIRGNKRRDEKCCGLGGF